MVLFMQLAREETSVALLMLHEYFPKLYKIIYIQLQQEIELNFIVNIRIIECFFFWLAAIFFCV